MIRNKIVWILVGLFLMTVVTEGLSQRRSSRSRTTDRDRDEEVTANNWQDKMAYDIFLGTLGFNGGVSISMKGGVGYKPIDRITLGGGGKFLYQFVNDIGTNDFSSFSYGFFPYARVKIIDQLYIKGEYNFYSFDTGQNNSDFDRINFNFPMLGAGYLQGYGKWKIGFEVMVLLNDRVVNDNLYVVPVEASDLYTLIEYNISFLYNF